MTNEPRDLPHIGDDNAFAARLQHATTAMQNMPILAAQNVKTSPSPASTMHVFAELGTYAGNGKLRQTQTSTAGCAGCSNGLVCEAGCTATTTKM